METISDRNAWCERHWVPHKDDPPPACRLPQGLQTKMLSRTHYHHTHTLVDHQQSTKKVVVWFSPHCSACQSSKDLFEAITLNKDGYQVLFREATAENLTGFPHIQMVPTYDVVHVQKGTHSVYGSNTQLTTIRNYNIRDLLTLMPSVSPPS